MGRFPTILQSEFPYNIGSRCINKEWFQLPMDEVWNIFCEELTRSSKSYNLKIHSFVLMSNHFHLLASTPDANISQCMQQLLGRTSKRLTKSAHRINETFAGRILQSHTSFMNAYKYNYRNPVAAGLVKKVEDYPFSTLPSVMGRASHQIPLEEDSLYNVDPSGILSWLNTEPEVEKWEAAQWGFTKPIFESKKARNTNKVILGENDLL